jgi:hypothetical protein
VPAERLDCRVKLVLGPRIARTREPGNTIEENAGHAFPLDMGSIARFHRPGWLQERVPLSTRAGGRGWGEGGASTTSAASGKQHRPHPTLSRCAAKGDASGRASRCAVCFGVFLAAAQKSASSVSLCPCGSNLPCRRWTWGRSLLLAPRRFAQRLRCRRSRGADHQPIALGRPCRIRSAP